MKKHLLILITILSFTACSFAPVTVDVPDFSISLGSSTSSICYTSISEAISVEFTSVVYEGAVLYQAGSSLGDNSEIELAVFGRTTDPDPNSNNQVKCVNASNADVLIADEIVVQENISKRISVGGSELARLVTEENYWIGASVKDNAILSLSGNLEFSQGVIKASF